MCTPYLEKIKTYIFDCNSVKSQPILIIFTLPKPEKNVQTGHAFNYLLLKESVATDVTNVSLFAYNEILR